MEGKKIPGTVAGMTRAVPGPLGLSTTPATLALRVRTRQCEIMVQEAITSPSTQFRCIKLIKIRVLTTLNESNVQVSKLLRCQVSWEKLKVVLIGHFLHSRSVQRRAQLRREKKRYTSPFLRSGSLESSGYGLSPCAVLH